MRPVQVLYKIDLWKENWILNKRSNEVEISACTDREMIPYSSRNSVIDKPVLPSNSLETCGANQQLQLACEQIHVAFYSET